MRYVILVLFSINLLSAQVTFEESAQQLGISINCEYTFLGNGITFFDYDNDGLDDITVATALGDPIYFYKNMAPEDFLKLLINSKCLIGNSSVGIRECSYLGVPVVNIGNRQTGRLRGGNVIDVNYNTEEIVKSIKKQLQNGAYPCENIYGDGNAGQKIAELFSSVDLSIEKRIKY